MGSRLLIILNNSVVLGGGFESGRIGAAAK